MTATATKLASPPEHYMLTYYREMIAIERTYLRGCQRSAAQWRADARWSRAHGYSPAVYLVRAANQEAEVRNARAAIVTARAALRAHAAGVR